VRRALSLISPLLSAGWSEVMYAEKLRFRIN
jgi:hypothetical protein